MFLQLTRIEWYRRMLRLHGRHMVMMMMLGGLHTPSHLLIIPRRAMVEHMVTGGPRVLPPVPRHFARDQTSLPFNGLIIVHHGRIRFLQ